MKMTRMIRKGAGMEGSRPPVTRQGIRGRLMRYLFTSLFITVLVVVAPRESAAYIMPAEQLVDFMLANFSRFKTVIITQSVYHVSHQDQEREFEVKEKIWLKSPDLLRSEVVSRPGTGDMAEAETMTGRPGIDPFFRRLLIAGVSTSVIPLLARMGINLDSVALTRLGGIIAYRLGGGDPENPRLLIEKRRFLPLLMRYPRRGSYGMEMVTVKFSDYRELAEGWYPYEISYVAGEKFVERYSVLTLNVNEPIEYPLARMPRENPGRRVEDIQWGSGTVEEEHLREIIEVLKAKYR